MSRQKKQLHVDNVILLHQLTGDIFRDIELVQRDLIRKPALARELISGDIEAVEASCRYFVVHVNEPLSCPGPHVGDHGICWEFAVAEDVGVDEVAEELV